MHDKRYVVVPKNEVIDEMRNSSPIAVESIDGEEIVFSFRGCNEPSCFEQYVSYNMDEWREKCEIKEKDNWGYSDRSF
jgi:hypothetical protein